LEKFPIRPISAAAVDLDSDANLAHMHARLKENPLTAQISRLSMSRDEIYQAPKDPVGPFEFDDQVARVFDDMADRSIPFYREIIHRQAQLIERHYQPGTVIFDLGCSNGNLSLEICRRMGGAPFRIVAVDNSAPMLKAFAQRLAAIPGAQRITLKCEDVARTEIENASVVVLNFTLQFLPPEGRFDLIAGIYRGMTRGGILLFSEKITHFHPSMAELQQALYYSFKRENGYSDLEISQKREALDKVLIPETVEQHQERLRQAGFGAIDLWQKWFNFAAWIAIK
jgi:tRNA (cmo5U34)-methyltransferase